MYNNIKYRSGWVLLIISSIEIVDNLLGKKWIISLEDLQELQ